MTINAKTLYRAALLLTLSALVSCSPGVRPTTQGVRGPATSGTYTVIFYGCNFLDDFETVAFLDKEGDAYSFEPFAPDFVFRVGKGLPAKEAFAAAEKFVNCSTAFIGSAVSEIVAPNGDTLGYEMKPRYQPFTYGTGDALDIDYRIKADKVVITVRLQPWVQNMLSGSGSDRSGNR